MISYLWVAFGSAIGGVCRYGLTQVMLASSRGFPYGTLLINILGSFLIGWFGTLTLQSTRYAAPTNIRLFVMVGICGGFTTFSAFSLQTLDLLRSGAWVRAVANIALSVVLCLAAVSAGHLLAARAVHRAAIAQTPFEENAG